MTAHVIPIKTAFLVFFILSFFLLIPWLVYSYRKYNYLSIWQSIVVYSFLFYSLSALFLVLLPLPLTRDTCAMQPADTVHFVLIPFAFIKTILADGAIVLSAPSTYINFFKHPAFFEVFFNSLLLFPLGVYLRYFFEKRHFWKKSLIIIFSTSLFFEITQLTGIYGIYNCAYRLFDTNDLIFNTLGGLIGFFLGSVLLAVFPKYDQVKQKARTLEDNISRVAVILALIVDLYLIQLVGNLIMAFIGNNLLIEIILKIILGILFIVILPLIWQGKTIGTAILRFKLVASDGQAFAPSIIKRAIAIAVPFIYLFVIQMTNLFEVDYTHAYYPYFIWTTFILLIGYIMLWIVIGFHALIEIFRHKRFYFDKVAQIQLEKLKKKNK